MVVTASALGAIVFCAVFPSICPVYLINVGIAALGPARMGIFNYLPPLFVAAIAIPVLGEELHRYHLVAFSIVTIGNAVSVRRRKLPKPRREILKGNSYENS